MAKRTLRIKQIAKVMQSLNEIELLTKVWPQLNPRVRAGILVTAGVLPIPVLNEDERHFPRTKRGETPAWLLPALNILKDSNGRLSDREIARRIGISCSTLIRNETYLRAREAYYLPVPKGAKGELEDIKPKGAKTR